MDGQVDEREGSARRAVEDGVDVFISHVEDDADAALRLADDLADAGYSTWCYERDAIPGPSYLLQTSQAIEHSRAVVVLVSPDSLGSHQVTSEVVRAHESAKPFIPLLLGISHAEFGARQPEWREAIGSAASLEVPDAGIDAIAPRIVAGLRALGLEPGTATPWSPAGLATPAPRPERVEEERRGRKTMVGVLVGVAVLAVLAVATVVLLALRGDEQQNSSGLHGSTPSAAAPTEDSSTGATDTKGSTSGDRGSVPRAKDARKTPLSTSQAPARIRWARLARKYCFFDTCYDAPTNTRWLVVRIGAWNQGDLVYNQQLIDETQASYVTFQGQRATSWSSSMVDGPPAGFDAVYTGLPPSLKDIDVILYWPDNPPLRLHVTE